jgi:S1-C subfamily serine protease
MSFGEEPSRPVVRTGFYRWTSLLLALLSLVLVWQVIGPRWRRLTDPNAGPRSVTPRGDLAADEKTTIELFRQASPSVVFITTVGIPQGIFDPSNMPEGAGSGFIWDDQGHIVTNYHVIRNAVTAEVTLADHSRWPARRVGHAEDQDLAVLSIDAPSERLRPMVIGSSHDLVVGQKVFAIGNPFGFDQTLTTGVISAVGREIPAPGDHLIQDAIQIDAAINPGNSGGPLLDSAGRLIGVNTAIASPTRSYAGIGFAIPVDTVNRIVPEIIRHGTPTRPGIGVIIASDEMSRMLLRGPGVVVRYVIPNRSADKAGIQQGDGIVAVNGAAIRKAEELHKALQEHQVGETIGVTVVRQGRKLDIDVRLQAVEGR